MDGPARDIIFLTRNLDQDSLVRSRIFQLEVIDRSNLQFAIDFYTRKNFKRRRDSIFRNLGMYYSCLADVFFGHRPWMLRAVA
jgi:hypothetical protein